MGHEEAFSELAAVALDAVSADVAHAVRTHASVCPECGPELAALEVTVGTIGELVPPAQINRGRSAGIRSRLLMRAAAEPRRITPPLPRRESSAVIPIRRHVNWMAIAATVALVATGMQLFRVNAERNALRNELVAADTIAPRTDSLAAALNQKDAMIAAMAGNDVKVVPLVKNTASEPLGRMVWNRTSDDWIMVTYNLKPPSPGKTYQVWLVTEKEKISAGTFRPDASGKTVMHAHYALARDALRAVAITEEPEGGMPAPTGPMVVSGSA